MKSIVFGVLALISIFMAFFFLVMFTGTILAYCGILMLLVAVIFACAFFESLPNYSKIADQIISYLEED